MSRSAPPVNRVFIHPKFSLFYRRAESLHWHEAVRSEYAALFMLMGHLKYERNGHAWELAPRRVLIIPPASVLEAEGENLECVVLAFSNSVLLEQAIEMNLVGPGMYVEFPRTDLPADPRLAELGGSVALELKSDEPGREIVLAALVEEIMVHLLRRHSNMKRSDELELSRVGLIDRRIRRAVELMHAQLDRDISLKEIAAASYLSPFHFSRMFKKLTGASPHAYLAMIRTRRAQVLLAETDLSISEISTRVGYSSSSHFTKAFRHATGLTPKAFRNAVVTRKNVR